jgi:DNA-directed RNA polymerase specialized sigma24 family protein
MTQLPSFLTSDYGSCNEQLWSHLYIALGPTIRGWVYSSHIPSWRGQEQDLAEDILQETVVRTFCYAQQAEQEEAKEIRHITRFGRTIAYHHFVDLRRKALNLTCLETVDGPEREASAPQMIHDDPAEEVIESLSLASLFEAAGTIIANLPRGQRTALLVDLAKQVDLLEKESPLQSAFAQTGIKLQDYLQYLPHTQQERTRQTALLSVAYRRLRKTFFKQRQDDIIANRPKERSEELPLRASFSVARKKVGQEMAIKQTEYDRAEKLPPVQQHEVPSASSEPLVQDQWNGARERAEMEAYVDNLREPYRTVVRLHYPRGAQRDVTCSGQG